MESVIPFGLQLTAVAEIIFTAEGPVITKSLPLAAIELQKTGSAISPGDMEFMPRAVMELLIRKDSLQIISLLLQHQEMHYAVVYGSDNQHISEFITIQSV